MAIKKVREMVHNGGTTGTESDYDTIYRETTEDMIVGQMQLLDENGWKLQPGGMIEQWGIAEIYLLNQSSKTITITLPIKFTKKAFGIKPSEMDNSITSPGNFHVSAKPVGLGNAEITISDINGTVRPNGRVRVYWEIRGE